LKATGVDGDLAISSPIWTASSDMDLTITGITISPTQNVSNWNPITLTASSSAQGTWSGKVYHPSGAQIGSLPAGSGLTYTATWAPLEYQSFTGSGYYAVVSLTNGDTTVTATAYFSMYNFKIKIESVAFLDANFTPIAHPLSNQPFFLRVTVLNEYNGTLASAFILVTVDSRYIGAEAVGGLSPGQRSDIVVYSSGLAAGTYSGLSYCWVDIGGPPIALPLPFSMTVSP
jgi:hypothetical protein